MSILAEIFRNKQQEVLNSKLCVSLETLRAQVKDVKPPRGFLHALTEANTPIALIAEVKKASPSQGVIRADFDAGEISRTYAEAGAHCLSVLTDEKYFQGSAQNLALAKTACGLPCLRKDFIDDPYQVWESRAWGADAILLIVAALEPTQLKDLMALAAELTMDVLVEVHSQAETEIALAAKALLIGVNNRDLSTFQTSLSISQTLIPQISPHAFVVSESALENIEDVRCVQSAGARAVLIGTRFTSSPDVLTAVRTVMDW